MEDQTALNLAPIERLPLEILYQMIQNLDQKALARLGKSSKALYTIVQRRLYSHVAVSSLKGIYDLVEAQGEIGRRERNGLKEWYTNTMGCGRKVETACIQFETMASSLPWLNFALLSVRTISDELGDLVRTNPQISISCSWTSDEIDELPLFMPLVAGGLRPKFHRVKSVKLFMGQKPRKFSPWAYSSILVAPRRRSNLNIIQRLLDHNTFPHLEEIALSYRLGSPSRLSRFSGELPEEDSEEFQNMGMDALEYITRRNFEDGLRNIKSLRIEGGPSLNPSMVRTLLEPTTALADNLVRLELYYCPIGIDDIVRLMKRTLPTLNHFALAICRNNSAFSICREIFDGAEANSPVENYEWHLCPHLRDLSQNLTTLKLDVPRICRRLWESPEEVREIAASGLATGGEPEDGPGYTAEQRCPKRLRETIENLRARTRSKKYNEELAELIRKAGESEPSDQADTSPRASSRQAEIKEESKLALDRYYKERQEKIITSGWQRLVVCWDYPCHSGEGWTQLEINADCGEEGVEWILALRNEGYERASRHMRGQKLKEIPIEEALSLWEDLS